LNFNLQGLSKIKDELLETPLIDKLLEMLPEGMTVEIMMPHAIMERTIIASSGALLVRPEWF